MTALWLTLIALLVVATAIIFFPLVIKHKRIEPPDNLPSPAIAIFKDRLAELESEQAQGTLEPAAFLALKTELEKTLLADMDALANPPLPPFKKGGGEEEDAFTKGGEVKGHHWVIAGGLAFFVVLTSLAMYVQLGRSEDFAQSLVLQAKAEQQAAEDKRAQAKLLKLIDLLKQKLAQHPADVEKWQLLGSSYAAMGNYPQAAQAYQAAMQAVGKNAPAYAAFKGSYAQMLFQAAGERITPETAQAVKETLAIDPLESSALLLSGIDAYNHGDIKQAIAYWQKAKTKANDNLIANFIDPIITQAQTQLGQPTEAKAVVSQAKITVNVQLDNVLKNKLKPEQTVFVFARPVGGKMPLAIEKLQVKDLPATVVLDDSKAAMPTAVLSSVTEVEITARVSLSGQAKEAKGDWVAPAAKVAVTEKGESVKMLINQEVE
jgi:cytochrome c-type biogenesis protein CcmH